MKYKILVFATKLLLLKHGRVYKKLLVTIIYQKQEFLSSIKCSKKAHNTPKRKHALVDHELQLMVNISLKLRLRLGLIIAITIRDDIKHVPLWSRSCQALNKCIFAVNFHQKWLRMTHFYYLTSNFCFMVIILGRIMSKKKRIRPES